VNKILSTIASESWEELMKQTNHKLTKGGSFCSSAISAMTTVVPRNKNSITEFILRTVFADSQSNLMGTAHAPPFIRL